MIAVIEILIAGLIVYTVGLPLVNMFDKWKKEMDKEMGETNEREQA